MITVFNAKNIAQQWFFQKAFATLKDKGVLTQAEQDIGRFLSLDGYFGHMKDLILINPVYAMLPSDEEPFIIDANARTIAIPASFNKCAAVVGDNMCEIATFVVDRYFDYVDLATTNICIQWSTKGGKEGISHITLIDTETIPGKIRFGWPLTNLITGEAGPVSFAIRFFIKDENQEIKYVLNTLKTVITIREGLELNNENISIESNNDLFTSFIKNSDRSSYPTPKPVTWGAPGLNLPTTKKIAEVGTSTEAANSFVIKAQGIVEDNGQLVYNWYFKSDEEDSIVEVLSKLPEEDDRYIIEEVFEEIATPEKRNGSEQYFIQDDTAPKGFSLVVGDLPTDKQLYERYTKLTVNPESTEQNITGEYWVGASNYVGESYVSIGDNGEKIPAQNHSPETNSDICKVLGPINITLSDNLEANKFIENNKAILSIDIEKDPADPLITYSWYYDDEEIDSLYDEDGDFIPKGEKINTENLSTYIAENVGWYYTTVTSKLNRKEKMAISNICRVINEPQVPAITMKYIKWDPKVIEAPSPDSIDWKEVNSENPMESDVALKGDVLRLQIDSDLANDTSKLLTDKLTYKWFVSIPDEGIREVIEADADKYGNGLILADCPVDQNYLDVICQENEKKYSYYCVVTNHLANKIAVFDVNSYNDIFFQIW